jgi:hypothetical protein
MTTHEKSLSTRSELAPHGKLLPNGYAATCWHSGRSLEPTTPHRRTL